jgi:SnoaL-like domain
MADDPIQQLLDIEAIKQLKGNYCRCVAIEDWDTFFTLFTEDLEFVTPNDGKVYSPRSAFYTMHKANLQDPKVWGVVHCYTPMIAITGPDSAHGTWGMEDVHIYPDTDPQVGHHGYGFYHEDYVRTSEGWKFKRIEVRYDRMDPLSGGFGPGPV